MTAGASLKIETRRPAGPVANAYEQSQAPVSCILGPTGGGKTVSSAKKVLRVAQWQHPSPRDGIRRARVTVVTPTYRQAHDSVIPSYRQVMEPLGVLKPPFGSWTGGKNEPVDHHFRLRWPPFGILDLQVLFRAVGDEELEKFVRGRETTAWWLPEMDTQPADLIGLASNRVGRYPAPDHRPVLAPGAPKSYAGVFGDANVPDLDSWFYDQMWTKAVRPEHWHLFRQPPGNSPNAENLENLHKIDPNYYASMAKDMKRWAIKRFIECKPGYSRHGEPVHDDFDEERHVVADIQVDPYLPMLIGVDGGGNTSMPAAAFNQCSKLGQFRVLDEFAPTENTSIEELGGVIKRTMTQRFRRARGAVIVGDPAMIQTQAATGRTYGQLLQHYSGIEVRMAPSQAPNARRGALRKKLRSRTFGGDEAFIVDQRCVALIKALAGGFQYRLADKQKGLLAPIKNQSSHIAEAEEYVVLGGEGMDGFDDGVIGPEGAGSDADYPAPVF